MDLEFEVRRIAAAFGVENRVVAVSEASPYVPIANYFIGANQELWWHYNLKIDREYFALRHPGTSFNSTSLQYFPQLGVHEKMRSPEHAVAMARGCFSLGKSIEKLEAHFGSLLTFHDKMACRDELPREFWPESWKGPQPNW